MRHARSALGALSALTLLVTLTGCPGSERRPDEGAPGAPATAAPTAPPTAAAIPSAEPPTTPAAFERPPTLGPAPKWAPPAVSIFTLPNGVAVWYLKQSQVPLASITVLVPRGAATDPPGKAGTTALMADMLDEGAGGKSSLELGEAFQRLGTDFEASVGTDATSLSVSLLADQVEPTLELLKTLLFRPDFPAAELERRKQQRIASLLAAEADPGSARSVVLRRMLFGDGYGGFPADGLRQTVSKITLADVKAQYRRVFASAGVVILVVGALERPQVEALMTKTFAGWKAGTPAKPVAITPKQAEPAIFFIDHPGATQSAISVATRAPGADTADLYESLYYNWAMGGAFMSRINLNLREQKGFTYGARSGYSRWREAGFFGVSALVKAQHTRESISEILSELSAAAQARPVTPKEVADARGGLLLSFPGRFENMGGVAGQLAELPLYGRAPDWYTQWPARVEAVTVDAVTALARRQGETGPYLVVIAGDRASVEPTLAALKLPVKYCDAQGNLLEK